MGKRLENISGVGKEIIKSLQDGSSRGLKAREILDILKEEEKDYTLKEINQGLGELIEYGSVRGKIGGIMKKGIIYQVGWVLEEEINQYY